MAERELRERERLAKMSDIKPQDMISPGVQGLPPAALAGLHMAGLPGQHMSSVEQLQYQGLIFSTPLVLTFFFELDL